MAGERLAAWVLAHHRVMRLVRGMAVIAQRFFVRQGRMRLPGRLHPAGERDLPVLAPQSFREWWRENN